MESSTAEFLIAVDAFAQTPATVTEQGKGVPLRPLWLATSHDRRQFPRVPDLAVPPRPRAAGVQQGSSLWLPRAVSSDPVAQRSWNEIRTSRGTPPSMVSVPHYPASTCVSSWFPR